MSEDENTRIGGTSAGGKRKRGQRGPTLAKSTANMKAGEKFSVVANIYNQSCERYSTTKLSTWIGVQALLSMESVKERTHSMELSARCQSSFERGFLGCD
ncbi:hypothetical protein NE237_031519 [Protea cynaroides]|uniref:Uncharacterized protein n=1 Tax=Protea cynaroides TaxID=273540 RepID=A0A9Q0R2K8_9MAGN|nr:hypothetical protein NE237_031519 [Protea cynaroides]